jgi:kynureninase
MQFDNTLRFARQLDQQDPLRSWRDHFFFPRHNGKKTLYFCGNSLGLQPDTVKSALLRELAQWKTYGVEGHFMGALPWKDYHHFLTKQSAAIAGALENEVVVMNTLTTNLHLLMISFYRPDRKRFKIIMEGGAFPSDQYAMETQVRYHGFDPAEAIVEVLPREGEYTLRTEDILDTIRRHGQETALVMFGGVNYYTGQFFDLSAITRTAHEVGAYAGFDLAHAAGNLPLQLHDWGVDFACWCSYKYLNAGPGGPGTIFVHERHGNDPSIPRLAGWWGHNEQRRFLMEKGFDAMQGAAGWQQSNAQIFGFAAFKASLDIFQTVGMAALRQKSQLMSTYMDHWLSYLNRNGAALQIITPSNPEARGCQFSLLTGRDGKQLHTFLSANGAICDWREPNVIRIAPVPLYNSFEDIYRFALLLKNYAK